MTTLVDVVRHRLSGQYEIDPWGYDAELVDLVDPLAGLRWRVDVVGAEHVPTEGAGILVANRRTGWPEPLVLGRGVRHATGRRIRFLGIPDVAPIGPALRRLGGAVGRPEELAALLRAGHLSALPLTRRWGPRRAAGTLDPAALAPAVELGLPVVPVGLVGRELLGRWTVFVGAPIDPPQYRGPLGLAEAAERARDGVQAQLDEASPPRSVFR